VLLFSFLLCGYGVVSFFLLGSETAALRNSCLGTTGGQWHKRIVLNVGTLSTSFLRFGAQFLKLPPEARTALVAVHGAEVGIYRQQGDHPPQNFPGILDRADKAMVARGWERVVGVVQKGELVAVYLPGKSLSPERVNCCVMVVHGDELVIVGARGNLQPLLSLAAERMHSRDMNFALR
jgi:hypothetical protein